MSNLLKSLKGSQTLDEETLRSSTSLADVFPKATVLDSSPSVSSSVETDVPPPVVPDGQPPGRPAAQTDGQEPGRTDGQADVKTDVTPARGDNRESSVKTNSDDNGITNGNSNRTRNRRNASKIPGLVKERERLERLSTYVEGDLFDRLQAAMREFGNGSQRKIVEYGLDAALKELKF